MDAVVPIKICKKCGVEGGRLASHFQEISNALYCPDCAPDIVFSCPRCREESAFRDALVLHGVQACRKCVEKETQSCTVCGMSEVAEPSKFVEVRGVYYCKGCLKKTIDTLVTVTTTPHIDGYRVKRYISIESVEYVIGTGYFSELNSDWSDFFGARSSAFEAKLSRAKSDTMLRLKYLAISQGGNAVIGIDLDYTEFSGNRVALILNGTIVEIEPLGTD
jgi:uncharacterized protein YbjQ (UPF0145 family)